jgi:(2Fe-2S) ferredoxin/SAM-dependent methyltransferase
MEPFRRHIYICTQKKPEGLQSCTAHGSLDVVDTLRREISRQGVAAAVQVTLCGSLGLCESGPNMVVYPDGVWYSGVQPGDVAELVAEQLVDGRVVERLLSARGDRAAVRSQIEGNLERRKAALWAREAAGVLPDDLHRAINGFRESRTLLTAIELDVFTAVGEGADAGTVARSVKADPRATRMLLNALVALGVLAKRAGTFENTPTAARFLVAGAAHDARAALMHTVDLWSRWSTLTDAVRRGTAVPRREDEVRDARWTEAFIAAMHRNAAARAPGVVRAVGTDGVRRMLDIGGGSGAYSIAFARSAPGLRAEILDLVDVAPIARRHIREAGVEDRVEVRVGDYRDADFGTDCDLILLSAFCHMLGPDGNRQLFRKAFAALAPGGRVVIQDFILDADGTAPRTGALFALNMLVGTRAGSAYSEPEYARWLADAGFDGVRHVPLPGPTDLIIGRRGPAPPPR